MASKRSFYLRKKKKTKKAKVMLQHGEGSDIIPQGWPSKVKISFE
jgi:hypothetical protein